MIRFGSSLVLSFAAVTLAAADFATDVLPIFEKHCLECHGEEKQKSGFRLDLRSAAMAGGSSGEVVVSPGRSAESSLIAHVTAPADDDQRMPPKGEGLSDAEVDALREWIDGGAVWPDSLAGADERLNHWAWQPLVHLSDDDRKTIDDFVIEKLAEKNLTLSPEADRRTLIRRLSFDLHGLPPSPEDVENFVNDVDAQAYEKLVDRMLASPHYGERMARHWLDIAHYADTHGFERDKRRPNAWRYRDYVIDAFNGDKPYARFIQEQIAGDVLFPGDTNASVATGFLAAGPWDFVGHVETKSPELRREARSLDLDDMATQVMTATMGMTVNCARCHDHKLDPISHKEYYQLRAVFAGVKREERVISQTALEAYEAEKERLSSERDQLYFKIAKLEGEGLDLADIVGGGNGHGTGVARQGIDARTGKVQMRDFGNLGNVKTNHFSKSEFEFVEGVFIPDGKDGAGEIPITSKGLTVSGLPTTSGAAWDMIRNGPVASQHSPELGGIDFTKSGHSLLGLHANAGITFDLAAIRRANGNFDQRFTARLGYFGAAGAHRADVWIFVDGEKVAEFRQLKRADGLKNIDIEITGDSGFLTLMATDGGNGYGHDQIGFGDPKLKPFPAPEKTDADRKQLTELRKEIKRIESESTALGSPPKYYGVVAEEKIPDVKILSRGDAGSGIGEPLMPGAFSALAMLDPDLGNFDSTEADRRAALAKWITNPENPLTLRVIVNRMWHWHFGQGIVTTPSDFGLGGSLPSHPELLDFLSTKLIEQKGSLKAVHRLMLNSATYKQQSRFASDAKGVGIDAGNRLLWRQNPRRIEAEAIRDAVLFVSGKLNSERGGPGFEDFKYTEAYAPIYEYVTADRPELWRRSIYRYIVRTTPDRFLATLDCPDPANLTPKRLNTTTPLQSLALFNNDFMLRQARYFAERINSERPDAPVLRAFELAFAREPTESEMLLGKRFIEEQGMFAFCRSLLNTNEFVYVD